MSKLLIQEPPLQVLPSLAKAIGLNEAIILQQIQYWMNSKNVGKIHDGKKWIYNSVPNWQKDNFPFWSEKTIKRALTSLRNQELVLTANLNKAAYDRTLWYTINYEQLEVVSQSISTECPYPSGQIVPMEEDNLTPPIPETTSETTHINNNYINDGVATDSQIQPLVDALTLVSSQRYHNGNKKKYDDVALDLHTQGATPELINGFGDWWEVNCYYNPPKKAALKTISDEWGNYTMSKERAKNLFNSDGSLRL